MLLNKKILQGFFLGLHLGIIKSQEAFRKFLDSNGQATVAEKSSFSNQSAKLNTSEPTVFDQQNQESELSTSDKKENILALSFGIIVIVLIVIVISLVTFKLIRIIFRHKETSVLPLDQPMEAPSQNQQQESIIRDATIDNQRSDDQNGTESEVSTVIINNTKLATFIPKLRYFQIKEFLIKLKEPRQPPSKQESIYQFFPVAPYVQAKLKTKNSVTYFHVTTFFIHYALLNGLKASRQLLYYFTHQRCPCCQKNYIEDWDYAFNKDDLMGTIVVDQQFFYSDHILKPNPRQFVSTQTVQNFGRNGMCHQRSRSIGHLSNRNQNSLIESESLFHQADRNGLRFLKLDRSVPNLQIVSQASDSFRFEDKNENYDHDKQLWEKLQQEILEDSVPPTNFNNQDKYPQEQLPSNTKIIKNFIDSKLHNNELQIKKGASQNPKVIKSHPLRNRVNSTQFEVEPNDLSQFQDESVIQNSYSMNSEASVLQINGKMISPNSIEAEKLNKPSKIRKILQFLGIIKDRAGKKAKIEEMHLTKK